jgi:hypothetical protein
MGLAPSGSDENPGKSAGAKVPVPIFSQPRSGRPCPHEQGRRISSFPFRVKREICGLASCRCCVCCIGSTKKRLSRMTFARTIRNPKRKRADPGVFLAHSADHDARRFWKKMTQITSAKRFAARAVHLVDNPGEPPVPNRPKNWRLVAGTSRSTVDTTIAARGCITSALRMRRPCRQTGGSRGPVLVQSMQPDMACRLRSPAVPA